MALLGFVQVVYIMVSYDFVSGFVWMFIWSHMVLRVVCMGLFMVS
jgi:hypothetical protein